MAEGKFHKAAIDGNLDILRSATRKDLNYGDEDGMTPTLWASYHGNLDALRMIFGRGGEANKADITGFTPLHHAAKNNHINIVSYLVNYGCNIWALDNDYHTALDIAGLCAHEEIVKFLDLTYNKQQQLNPKIVQSLRERAMRDADQNIKKYEKRQKEAMRIAEKESRRIVDVSDAFRPPNEKTGFFKTLTLRLKGTKKFASNNNKAKSYSEMTHTGSKGGVQRRIMQKRNSEDNSDFRISEMDEQGQRTFKSLSGVPGVVKDDVMYMTDRDTGGGGVRPALKNVFPGIGPRTGKWKSESDILDSGIEYDEEDNTPGLFNIGLGKISFLHTKHGLAGTLNSMEKSASNDMLDAGYGTMNGFSGVEDIVDGDSGIYTARKRNSSGADSLETASNIEKRMETIPWNQEDVDSSDDDEVETELSALFRFLETCGLSHFMHLFKEEEVNLEALMHLTDGDLEKLGLKIGPRRMLQDAIKRRKEVLSEPGPMSDTLL